MPEFEQILTMFLIFALMGICPEENTELHVDAEGHFSIHRGSGGDGGPSRPVSSIPGIKDFATALYEFLDKDCLIPDLLAQVAACAAKIRLAGGLASQLSGFKAALDRKKSNNKGAVEFLNGAYKRCKEDLEDLVRGLDEAVGKILDEGDLGNKPALFAAHVASLLQGHVQEELRPNLVLARVLIEGEWKPVFLRRFVAGTSVKNEKKRRQDEDGGGGDGEAEDGGDGVAGDDYAGRWDDDDMLPDAPHDVRSEMKRVERQFLSIPARLGRQIVRARDAGATIPDVILKRVKEPGGNWKQGAELTEALAGLSAAVAHKYLCTESMIALKPLVPGVGDPLKPSDLKRPRDDSLHHDAVKELGAKEARELWERTLEGHSVILNTDPEIEGTLPGVPFAVLLDRNNFGPLVRGELTKTNLRMLIVLQSKGLKVPPQLPVVWRVLGNVRIRVIPMGKGIQVEYMFDPPFDPAEDLGSLKYQIGLPPRDGREEQLRVFVDYGMSSKTLFQRNYPNHRWNQSSLIIDIGTNQLQACGLQVSEHVLKGQALHSITVQVSSIDDEPDLPQHVVALLGRARLARVPGVERSYSMQRGGLEEDCAVRVPERVALLSPSGAADCSP